MTRSECITGAVLTLILIASIPIAVEGDMNSEMDRLDVRSGDRTEHKPISIHSNSEFDQFMEDEGFKGSGTDQDPYIIRDLSINASRAGNGIRIVDTTRIFMIQNCRIYGASDLSEETGYGIYLYNVNVFSIFHCFIHDNDRSGIHAEINRGEIGCSISLNDIMRSGRGISLQSANNFIINENRVYDNEDGIISINSIYCYIYENEIFDNTKDGIKITENTKGGISRNLLMNNGRYGIWSRDSTYNLIFENSLIGNNGATEDFDEDHVQAADQYIGVTSRNTWRSQFGKGNHWRDWIHCGFNGSVKSYPIYGGISYDDSPLGKSVIKAPPSSVGNFSGTVFPDFINLLWEIPLDNGCSEISGYVIEKKAKDIPSMTAMISLGGSCSYYADNEIGCDGSYSYTISALNEKGASIESGPISIIVDRTSPSVEIISPDDGIVLDKKNVIIEWTAADGLSGIERSLITLNEGPWIDVRNETSYEITLIEPGEYRFRVKAFDRSGNNRTACVNFTYDGGAPDLFIDWGYEGTIVNRSAVSVGFHAVDDHFDRVNYSIMIDGNAWIQLGDSTQTLISDLSDGDHILRISASDPAGNRVEKSIFFTTDTTPPVLEIMSPWDGAILFSNETSVKWDSYDLFSGIWNNTLRVDRGPWIDMKQRRSFSAEYLAEGPHTVDIKVHDCAGHSTISSIGFIVDMEYPRILNSYPGRGSVSPNTKVSVLFSEPMDTSGTFIKVSGIGGRCSWKGLTLTYEPIDSLEIGKTYNVEVTGYDTARNRMDTFTWTFTVLPDTSVGDSIVAGIVYDRSGKPVNNATVQLDGYYVGRTDYIGGFHFTTCEGIHFILIRVNGRVVHNETFIVGDNASSDLGNIMINGENDPDPSDPDIRGILPVALGMVVLLIILVVFSFLFVYFRNRTDFEVVIDGRNGIEIDGEPYQDPGLSSNDEDNLKIMFASSERPLTPQEMRYQYPPITAEDLYGPMYADDAVEDDVQEEIPDASSADIPVWDEDEFEIEQSEDVQSGLDLTILTELEDLKVDEAFTWKDLANPLYERDCPDDLILDDLNCYKILGVDPHSSPNEIRLAYRKLARDYHPDKISRHDSTLKRIAGEEMKKLNYAKETLLNPDLRQAHDMKLQRKRP